jgi:hypothetical protein
VKFFPKREKKKLSKAEWLRKIVSWIFVLGVSALVGLLLWQFISRIWVKPPVSSTRERNDLLVRAGEHIQLTVMNGSGSSGAARVFTDFLRARKFDVVEMTNFSSQNVPYTYVIDKVADSVSAQKVAYALGISYKRIVREVDTNAFVDAAVVIGKDFQSTNPLR